MSAGRPINQDPWPAPGPHRRFLELLDQVHRANGTKSLRTIAQAMNLSGPNRVSVLLRGTSLPTDEGQARALVRALGGSAEDIQRGVQRYLQVRSAAGGPGRTGRLGAGTALVSKHVSSLWAPAFEASVARREAEARARFASPTMNVDVQVNLISE